MLKEQTNAYLWMPKQRQIDVFLNFCAFGWKNILIFLCLFFIPWIFKIAMNVILNISLNKNDIFQAYSFENARLWLESLRLIRDICAVDYILQTSASWPLK